MASVLVVGGRACRAGTLSHRRSTVMAMIRLRGRIDSSVAVCVPVGKPAAWPAPLLPTHVDPYRIGSANPALEGQEPR